MFGNKQNQKSILAKLLASENLNVRHSPKAKTGYFDVNKRVLTLPIWKDMSDSLYDLLVGHETGHALETPKEFKTDLDKLCAEFNAKPQNMFGFFNVIEDARIDKLQKRRYPGLRKDYFEGYNELIDKNFFGTKNKDVNEMNFIDRLNIYEKGGSMLGIEFTDKERDLVKEVENLETWEDVVEAVRKIYAYAKYEEGNTNAPDSDLDSSEDGDGEGEKSDKKKSKNGKKSSSKKNEDGEPQGGSTGTEDADADDEDGDSDGEGDSDGDGDEDGEGNGSSESDGEGEDGEKGKGKGKNGKSGDEDSDEDGEGAGNKPIKGTSSQKMEKANGRTAQGGGGGSGAKGFVNPDPKSETDENWIREAQKLIDQSAASINYASIPDVSQDELKKIVVDYPEVLKQKSKSFYGDMSQYDKQAAEFRTNEKETISFMLKEFYMRKAADASARTTIARTGVLNLNKLYSYQYSDDLFKKMSITKDGKNHGFVMFVDWSGSMNGCLADTVKQMISLTLFCKAAQIPFEVYSFKTVSSYDNLFKDRSDGRLYWSGGFQLRNLLSSRMKISDFNKSINYLFYQINGVNCSSDELGGTPLDPAIVASEYVVREFQKRSKVQIVNVVFLTDGQSDGLGGIAGSGYSNSYGSGLIIQDTKMKTEYDSAKISMTNTLLKVLKNRTDCNLIGFYIYNGTADNARYFMSAKEKAEVPSSVTNKTWTEEGHIVVKSSGYDENYILNDKMMSTKIPSLVMTAGMSDEEKTAGFVKFSKSKSGRRAMLRKFITKICKA